MSSSNSWNTTKVVQEEPWTTIPTKKELQAKKNEKNKDKIPKIWEPTRSPYGINDPTSTIIKNKPDVTETEKTKEQTQYSKKNSSKQYDGQKMYNIDEMTMANRIDKVGVRLGQTIGAARTQKKWSQEELAQNTSLPVSVIKDWEKADAIFDAGIMQKIATALEVSLRK